MKIMIAAMVALLYLSACGGKPGEDRGGGTAVTHTARVPSETTAAPAIARTSEQAANTDPVADTTTAENEERGTWAGQIAVAQPVSMFNYVGAESGDFAPMRFRNDSDAGKKILATCPDGTMCEFTGTIEWLDEAPPPDASAIGRIIRVDRVKRISTTTP